MKLILALIFTLASLPAHAHKHSHHAPPRAVAGTAVPSVAAKRRPSTFSQRIRDGRPRAWCGWQMRQWFGGPPELNLARNWARVGHAVAAQIGAIVVWPHHVGYIVGRAAGEWVIKSGNDGHRVRERPRSITGAIAVRML